MHTIYEFIKALW